VRIAGTSVARMRSARSWFSAVVLLGLAPKRYGHTLEIDHIVSLELGGSNDIANLYPEKVDAHPGFKAKDKLENRLHDLVCSGQIGLRTAQRQIASDWQKLYRKVYGTVPTD
jgi:hypothetical protein